jgi:hypothetical protein
VVDAVPDNTKELDGSFLNSYDIDNQSGDCSMEPNLKGPGLRSISLRILWSKLPAPSVQLLRHPTLMRWPLRLQGIA